MNTTSNSNGTNIWQLQARGDVAGIIKALDIPDPMIRSRAILALLALKASNAVPNLKQLRAKETNTEIKRLIDQTLEYLDKGYQPTKTAEKPSAESRETLLERLKSDDEAVVEAAIHALGKLGDQTVVEALILIFQDSQKASKLRYASAEALLALESAPASVSLLGALRKSDWQVRRNAAAVLGQLRSDWAVIPLTEVMNSDPSVVVRKTAAAALQRLNTPEALQALQKPKPANHPSAIAPRSTVEPKPPPEAKPAQQAPASQAVTTPAPSEEPVEEDTQPAPVPQSAKDTQVSKRVQLASNHTSKPDVSKQDTSKQDAPKPDTSQTDPPTSAASSASSATPPV